MFLIGICVLTWGIVGESVALIKAIEIYG